jgi:hypothetical protein
MDAVIVTGGFLHRRDRPDAITTDVAALEGAHRYGAEYGVELASCFEAWVPEPGLDRRPDVGGVLSLLRIARRGWLHYKSALAGPDGSDGGPILS